MIKIHDDRSVRSDRHSLNVAAAVQTAVSPAVVILFGSRATGSHSDSSDIDLLLVVDYGNTIAPELMARRAAQDFMAARPPLLDTDIIVFTRREFDRYRLANQHIAGQAANYGVVMNGDVLDEPAENEDGFPDHWPETRQRLENVLEYQFHFNQMVDENIQNQRLTCFLGQQALEDALKGWLSTFNDKRTFGHELLPLWQDILSLEDWSGSDMKELRQVIDELFAHLKYEDPQAPGITMDWLTLYAATYRYTRPSHRMTRQERTDLQEKLNKAINGISDRIHLLSGTSNSDLWIDDIRPWDQA